MHAGIGVGLARIRKWISSKTSLLSRVNRVSSQLPCETQWSVRKLSEPISANRIARFLSKRRQFHEML
jgi:hypothetical protein